MMKFSLYSLISFSILLGSAAASDTFESLYAAPRGQRFPRNVTGTESIKVRLPLKQQIWTPSTNGEYILFRTDIRNAGRMLETEFAWYKSGENQEVLRTLQYSVPAQVVQHINFVQLTMRFGSPKPFSSTAQIIDVGQKSDGLSQWFGSSPVVNRAPIKSARWQQANQPEASSQPAKEQNRYLQVSL